MCVCCGGYDESIHHTAVLPEEPRVSTKILKRKRVHSQVNADRILNCAKNQCLEIITLFKLAEYFFEECCKILDKLRTDGAFFNRKMTFCCAIVLIACGNKKYPFTSHEIIEPYDSLSHKAVEQWVVKLRKHLDISIQTCTAHKILPRFCSHLNLKTDTERKVGRVLDVIVNFNRPAPITAAVAILYVTRKFGGEFKDEVMRDEDDILRKICTVSKVLDFLIIEFYEFILSNKCVNNEIIKRVHTPPDWSV